jgi:prepilin peptidase CpaA
MFSQAASLVLFPALMAFAASSDLLTMTISNRVSLALLAGFGLMAAMTGMSLTDIGLHFGAAAVVLLVAFICFARGWIGGGDAKLAAATALWLGFPHLIEYLLAASIFGGVLTLLIIGFRRFPLPPFLAGQAWLDRLHRPDAGVPYGIALAIAALVVYPHTVWMKAFAG